VAQLVDQVERADLAGGNDISVTTIRRQTDEVIALLAARAPRLDRTVAKIAKRGGEAVLIDGTLIRTRRRDHIRTVNLHWSSAACGGTASIAAAQYSDHPCRGSKASYAPDPSSVSW
jgi:hypothetical protein